MNADTSTSNATTLKREEGRKKKRIGRCSTVRRWTFALFCAVDWKLVNSAMIRPTDEKKYGL